MTVYQVNDIRNTCNPTEFAKHQLTHKGLPCSHTHCSHTHCKTPLSLSFYLTFSLSHTHTHTQPHIHTDTITTTVATQVLSNSTVLIDLSLPLNNGMQPLGTSAFSVVVSPPSSLPSSSSHPHPFFFSASFFVPLKYSAHPAAVPHD